MIENVMIFSKETGEIVVTTTLGSTNLEFSEFSTSLNKIQEIATRLEKGVFVLDLENNLFALILAVKVTSVVLVFSEKVNKKDLSSWENVAKQIASGFEKIFESNDKSKFTDYEKNIKEIIDWQLRELSPVDKMKDALW